MRLRDLLTVVENTVTLEISGQQETYSTKASIPHTRMNSEVKRLATIDSGLIIQLGEPRKVPTLEELGYSFEVGM
ncbi:hypothetical protein [Paenibacillus sabinae]|uniref:Uncharacterized protein n=1 Tax=Paenibacillus sabinae T27 TaxID=1268072 RepID=X5A2K6_9BACL|nr:hypothetical protein [Paenibacillus sabinae]AHV98598.1 hypothetical protein PSAB_18520 [Paenibacillus sabinae T27]